jgi:hypothetical protein
VLLSSTQLKNDTAKNGIAKNQTIKMVQQTNIAEIIQQKNESSHRKKYQQNNNKYNNTHFFIFL